jgi:hypothetical protein
LQSVRVSNFSGMSEAMHQFRASLLNAELITLNLCGVSPSKELVRRSFSLLRLRHFEESPRLGSEIEFLVCCNVNFENLHTHVLVLPPRCKETLVAFEI